LIGFADGHQPMERPLRRTTPPQLTHQKAVRQREGILCNLQASFLENLDIPIRASEEAIEAGLIGSCGELAIGTKDDFALDNHQAVEILSEMPALTLNGEDLTVMGDCVVHDLREFENPWHEQRLHHPCAPDQN